jgi:hypothetical protein
VKSIKTSLLFASVLATSVAFAQDGPSASTTVQLPNSYDLATLEELPGGQSNVFHQSSNRGFKRIVYSVAPLPAARVLVVEEKNKVSRIVEQTRYDIVEKQNAFDYKYKQR